MRERQKEAPEAAEWQTLAILRFWFGEEVSPAESLDVVAAPEVRERWFGGGEDFDRDIERRFGSLLAALERSLREGAELAGSDLLADSPAARVARILVLDQFSRNLHRGTAGMFATDDLAIAETLEGLRRGEEARIQADARAFFLMPLMHSEDPEMQALCVESFAALADGCEPGFRERAENYLGFAEQHRVIVDRFGRYPHRNELLERESTAEEKAFLQEPGSSF